MDQSFTLKITGRMEEWEEPYGAVEFRFFPEPGAEGKEGLFKVRVGELGPMKETEALLEGDSIVGLGNWFFGATAPGKELTAFPRDASGVGRVLKSTHPTLPLGTEKVPIQLVMVPKVEREYPPSKQPLIRFPEGPDLWALRTANGPLTVTGEIKFDEKSPGQEIKGTTWVTFEFTPKPKPSDGGERPQAK